MNYVGLPHRHYIVLTATAEEEVAYLEWYVEIICFIILIIISSLLTEKTVYIVLGISVVQHKNWLTHCQNNAISSINYACGVIS